MALFINICRNRLYDCASTGSPRKYREYNHPNGLVVRLNKDFSAKENENGFTVEPLDGSNENVRFPIEIKISLHKGKEFPIADSLKRKDAGNRKISYQTEKDDGGSGGETYSFTGFEKISEGYIEYSQTVQSKYSEPDFQTIWETIENTSLKKIIIWNVSSRIVQ